MKKHNFIYVVSLATLLLVACSSSDDAGTSEDIIIGKWRAIEKYESNQAVDLPLCLPHIFVDYKPDNTVDGGKILSDSFPESCNQTLFDSGIIWENLGNGNYHIGTVNETGRIYNIFKEGVNLVEINPDGITKIIYEPY
ncbi:hypothetical protein ACFSQP_08370 [Bizionia sediminis]|uniref:Lipocalin-like domain-containing protein n=1 Tax=Bizionia sediminis TaxID=1737064 RepID=A0ABW5KTQ5_9FLAO